MNAACVVVPPLIKYGAGPLLGPAMLAGAARAAGFTVRVVDLNISYLREKLTSMPLTPSGFAGDHDKPGTLLRGASEEFRQNIRSLLPAARSGTPQIDPADTAAVGCEAMVRVARSLAATDSGEWIAQRLEALDRPSLLGVSLLFGGQVYWALATTLVAKKLWPDVPIVWGGPHITALQDVIAIDHRLGEHIDGFVFGHAERTFVELLAAIRQGRGWPREVIRAGSSIASRAKAGASVVPCFEDLEAYGIPRLTLPVQASKGCAYARCAFCSYPAIEGAYAEVETAALEPIIAEAAGLDAVVCFKDSLLLPARLREIASLVRGRVRWAGCTKIHQALDRSLLASLAAAGCDTLELGLESADPRVQFTIHKRQRLGTFLNVVDAAAHAGISLVVNYITGFPGEDPGLAGELLHQTLDTLDQSGVRFQLEHNRFQLQRLAPMARSPARYGLRIVQSWPWASILDWEWRPARELAGVDQARAMANFLGR
ncbi:MAG: cobalamin B12-binding domain-containing protein [Deltaproteobacteria bacterium]|nr:cobalamin B12-binding domain-containing protein [Deltaproteobacteria bacterium]